MNAIYLYPEDIGLSQFSAKWQKLCEKFGYEYTNPPCALLLVDIKPDK